MNKAPVFQHRHYKAIAALIAEQRNMVCAGEIPTAHFAMAFERMFAQDNPRFDRARFLAAANGKPSNGRDKVRS